VNGSSVVIEDFVKVRDSSEKAQQALDPDPYFLCFQMVLSAMCDRLETENANPGIRIALIFEKQEEFSSRTKILLV
jgi:hypothetical protein